MNIVKTALLLAALTALFGAIGLVLGGRGGMMIALGIAALTNLYAYWNSDSGSDKTTSRLARCVTRFVGLQNFSTRCEVRAIHRLHRRVTQLAEVPLKFPGCNLK